LTVTPPPLPPPSSDHPGVVVLGDPEAEEQAPLPLPLPRPRLDWTKRAAAVVSGLAAATLVAGTLLPYQFFSSSSGIETLAQRVETTSWAVTVSRPSTGIDYTDNSHPPYFGIPVCVIAVALLICIGLLIQGSSSAKATIVAAAAAAATMVAMLATSVASSLSSFDFETKNNIDVVAGVGSGMWVLLIGAVLAAAAAVLACLRTPPSIQDTDDTADMDTPPMGFPAPVLPD
jgi:hypothetical protein